MMLCFKPLNNSLKFRVEFYRIGLWLIPDRGNWDIFPISFSDDNEKKKSLRNARPTSETKWIGFSRRLFFRSFEFKLNFFSSFLIKKCFGSKNGIDFFWKKIKMADGQVERLRWDPTGSKKPLNLTFYWTDISCWSVFIIQITWNEQFFKRWRMKPRYSVGSAMPWNGIYECLLISFHLYPLGPAEAYWYWLYNMIIK